MSIVRLYCSLSQNQHNVGYFRLFDNILTFERLLGTLHALPTKTPMAANLDDLIYSFLLQSDFPRASIILDLDLLGPAAQVGTDMHRPSFVIADPLTAEVLAVINVVEAIDDDTLRQEAIETGAFASRLGGRTIQGFVIRVDVRGRTEEEQIQFYRIWPNSTLQQMSSKSFPDLDTLRVARKLAVANTADSARPESGSLNAMKPPFVAVEPSPSAGLYVPAIMLLVLVFADSVFTANQGTPLLTVSHSILASCAAFLFTLPAAIRYLRK